MKVADLPLDPRVAPILKEEGIEDLYPPQVDAVGPALAGKSLVLAIPTASGKSLVAYLAILKAVLNGGKAMYIVPLRALASEKYEDLKAFAPLGVKVGISMGDYDSPDPALERFDVIVATSERADSLLRHRSNWLRSLSVVVADEVHLINDGDRGPTLEVTLAKLKQVNPRAQVIALSATIQNSDQIAAWLGADHISSEWRPVRLRTGVHFDGTIHFTDGEKRSIRVDSDDAVALVLDALEGGGQCLVFVNTRRSTETLARKLGAAIKKTLDPKALERLKGIGEDVGKGQEETTSMASRLARCIEGGAAFHNAGLTNAQRGLVEREFKKGRIRCIVATPTLSQGINAPARRVVIRDLNRFDVNYGLMPIPRLEVMQMAGRAGRPRYDPYGEALLAAKDEDDVDELIDEYFRSPPEAIESKLGSEPALRFHTLAAVATEHATTDEALLGFYGRTFFAHCEDVNDLRGKIGDVLAFLEKEDFLVRRDGALRATFFGRRTSDLYIDPLSAVKLRDALESDRDSPFYHLWAVCSTPDMPKLYLRRGDYQWVEDKITQEGLTGASEDYEFLQAEVKTASLFEAWTEERTEDEITKRFGIGPGDIRRLVDQGEWLLYGMAELGSIFNKGKVRDLRRLTTRLQYGVQEELLELVQLRGIGRVRARALFRRGLTNLREIQKADVLTISNILGPALAKSVKEQVGQKGLAALEGQSGLEDFA